MGSVSVVSLELLVCLYCMDIHGILYHVQYSCFVVADEVEFYEKIEN